MKLISPAYMKCKRKPLYRLNEILWSNPCFHVKRTKKQPFSFENGCLHILCVTKGSGKNQQIRVYRQHAEFLIGLTVIRECY